MSRLIDADKLPATCNVAIVNGKVELNGWIAAERITEAPTVKAIPIEWIEKYKRVRGWEVTVTTQNAIDNMLNAWEKENEQNKDNTSQID